MSYAINNNFHVVLCPLLHQILAMLLKTFKIINRYYDLTFEISFKFDDAGRRGHSKKTIQEKKQIGYKEVCVCKPNCGKMECST